MDPYSTAAAGFIDSMVDTQRAELEVLSGIYNACVRAAVVVCVFVLLFGPLFCVCVFVVCLCVFVIVCVCVCTCLMFVLCFCVHACVCACVCDLLWSVR